ncbi:cyclin-dependent kinase inhibitor 2c [Anaeramoeba ignava]|uniref:Cyclin-dependent kinase inhibitor 2c n=1 Tax=Anaeramoeba ignava TaxID=1746090 RepID=A0A9Q0LG52_ANAIG|nr:cyclin-dependent kinase inhibitor 2c [Anaeramoeba ignava]
MDLIYSIREQNYESFYALLKQKWIDINEYCSLTPLLYACQINSSYETIKALLAFNALVSSVDGDTPLHIACKTCKDPNVINLLISCGSDVNALNNETPLHYSCKYNLNFLNIKLLLEANANLSIGSFGNTPIHFAVKNGAGLEIISLLMRYGADPLKKNGKSCLEICEDEKTKSFFNSANSFVEDYVNLFVRQEKYDVIFTTKDNKKIGGHQIFIENRIGKEAFNKAIHVFKVYNEDQVFSYLKMIYGDNEIEEDEVMKEISEKLEIDLKKIRGKKFLIQDMANLYRNGDESLKDFSIILNNNNEFIKTHIFVLMARSDLFRGMFLAVTEDKSNQVRDYSGKSDEALKILVEFLYTDFIQDDISDVVYEDLQDAVEYYQLNQNSSLYGILALKRIEGLEKKNELLPFKQEDLLKLKEKIEMEN